MSDNPVQQLLADIGKYADDCIDIVKSLEYIGRHLGKAVHIEMKHNEWHVSFKTVGTECHVTSPHLSHALRILTGRDLDATGSGTHCNGH